MNLTEPVKKRPGDKLYKCENCDYTSSDKSNLICHMRIHTGEKPHTCVLCGKAFTRKTYINIHMRNHAGEKPFKCQICDYASSDKSNLTRHMRKHTDEKPKKCKKRDKALSDKSQITSHIPTQLEEKPTAHGMRNEAFSQTNRMGEKPYQSETGDDFSHESSINDHRRKTNNVEIAIDLSLKNANSKGNIRADTGEKPYQCEKGDNYISHESSLNNHMSRKTSNVEIAIDLSLKNANFKGNIREAIYTGEKPYQCKKCDNELAHKSSLNDHMRETKNMEIAIDLSLAKANLDVNMRMNSGENC